MRVRLGTAANFFVVAVLELRTSGPLSVREGTTRFDFRTFPWRLKPESGLDCLICATFARKRSSTLSRSTPAALEAHSHVRRLSLSQTRTYTHTGRSAAPNLAYMLLPAAHPASMTPAVRAKMVIPFASRLPFRISLLLIETKVESGDVSKERWNLCYLK